MAIVGKEVGTNIEEKAPIDSSFLAVSSEFFFLASAKI